MFDIWVEIVCVYVYIYKIFNTCYGCHNKFLFLCCTISQANNCSLFLSNRDRVIQVFSDIAKFIFFIL